MVEKFEGEITLLTSIPGIQRRNAITIISEIGGNMAHFSSSKKLCCWAGLTPGNNESAGKKKTVRIMKAGAYLKPALVEAAHAAVACNEFPYYQRKFEKISKRRGKKRAYIAIARMILTAIYHMLSTGELWNPTDLSKSENSTEHSKATSIRHALKLLEQNGYLICPAVQTT